MSLARPGATRVTCCRKSGGRGEGEGGGKGGGGASPGRKVTMLIKMIRRIAKQCCIIIGQSVQRGRDGRAVVRRGERAGASTYVANRVAPCKDGQTEDGAGDAHCDTEEFEALDELGGEDIGPDARRDEGEGEEVDGHRAALRRRRVV